MRPVILSVLALILLAAPALAEVKRIPVTSDRAIDVLQTCLLDGGDRPAGTTGSYTMLCCATNSAGGNYCVACTGGTNDRPDNCAVTAGLRAGFGGLSPKAPDTGPLAPPAKNAPTRPRAPTGGNIVAPNNIISPNNIIAPNN